MKRQRLFKPSMDQGVQGWIFNTARENFWRVAEYYEFEDLLQDGGMIWAKIVRRYPGAENQKQFMALFKRAFTNHIHDLSKKASAIRYVREAEMPETFEGLLEMSDPDQDPDVLLLIRQLPPAIMRALRKMYAEGREHPFRLRLDGSRETTRERLCRLAGLDPAARDLRNALQAHLSGRPIHPQYD